MQLHALSFLVCVEEEREDVVSRRILVVSVFYDFVRSVVLFGILCLCV